MSETTGRERFPKEAREAIERVHDFLKEAPLIKHYGPRFGGDEVIAVKKKDNVYVAIDPDDLWKVLALANEGLKAQEEISFLRDWVEKVYMAAPPTRGELKDMYV